MAIIIRVRKALMPRTLSLRLLPLLLASLFTVLCSTVAAQDAGVQIRGPKTTDSSPIKQYGPINNADTLWKIALMVRPDPRFSVYQVMQALYVKNPQAFKENNLNYLVNGQYLKIPSYDEIASIDPQQAQAKSDADDNVWEKKVKSAPKVVAKKATPANVVQKKDLEQAKSEINEQLQDIGKNQEQRLETIQNDVLDSIDGLQAILQENEKLKNRLSNFDSQLGEMQQEVAKSEEMKVQMDALIKLQQELLDKANAREQELMIEKQKAALEDDNFTSSIWFTILVATVPAVLIVSLIAFFLMRRKSDDKPVEVETKAPVKEAEVKKEAAPEADELALDGELSLDDELAIDLTEDESLDDLDDTELGGDELFSDDLDDLDDELLDDDVIHLDDDLDDLEDISLDDLGDDQPLDDSTELAGDDIDDLLEQTPEEEQDQTLEGGELGQDMLDDLLSGLEITEEGSDDSAAEQSAEEAPSNTEDDIDALLNEVNDEQDTSADEVSDPDDIDSLLDEIGAEEPSAQEDVTDPDDIDSLLDEINDEVSDEVSAEEPSPQEDVTDPDDIDSLLDEINDEVSAEEPSPQEDVTDPDDIDSLLDEVSDEIGAEEPSAQVDVTDPDDIDSLLDEINDEMGAEEPSAQEDVTDPDDIDSLLDEISGNDESDNPTSKVELTDPDDIDALLSSFDDAPAESNDAELIEDDDSDVSDSENHDELNTQDIDNFTEEQVGQFLAMDFSDIGQEAAVDNDDVDESITPDENDDEEQEILDVDDILDAIQVEEVASADNSVLDESDVIEDDIASNDSVADEAAQSDDIDLEELDVEQLLADVSDENTTVTEDLLDDVNEQIEEVEAPFDESTLSHLLNETDTPAHDEPVELTPDFTDSNVLADLLSDGEVAPKAEAAEASEIEDIQELNNLDFDELLANIEEENAPSTLEEPIVEDVIEDLDIGDDLVAIEEDDNEPADFVSVDSLITDSLEPDTSEPYKSENIDVGLNEFPEFAGDETDIDEEDTNGVAAKLDLAKVYIEIGDEENAEVILQDVIKLGDAQQQFEAQQLLDNLS